MQQHVGVMYLIVDTDLILAGGDDWYYKHYAVLNYIYDRGAPPAIDEC